MHEVFIELFLLDNALMGLLILRVAAPLAKAALNAWMTVAACVGSAGIAALAMTNPLFLSLPVKALLLALMTAAFLPKSWKSAKSNEWLLWGRLAHNLYIDGRAPC